MSGESGFAGVASVYGRRKRRCVAGGDITSMVTDANRFRHTTTVTKGWQHV